MNKWKRGWCIPTCSHSLALHMHTVTPPLASAPRRGCNIATALYVQTVRHNRGCGRGHHDWKPMAVTPAAPLIFFVSLASLTCLCSPCSVRHLYRSYSCNNHLGRSRSSRSSYRSSMFANLRQVLLFFTLSIVLALLCPSFASSMRMLQIKDLGSISYKYAR